MKLFYDYKLKVNNSFLVDFQNILSYMEFMKTRELTSLEQRELQECIESLKKGGFQNVVEALGF